MHSILFNQRGIRALLLQRLLLLSLLLPICLLLCWSACCFCLCLPPADGCSWSNTNAPATKNRTSSYHASIAGAWPWASSASYCSAAPGHYGRWPGPCIGGSMQRSYIDTSQTMGLEMMQVGSSMGWADREDCADGAASRAWQQHGHAPSAAVTGCAPSLPRAGPQHQHTN
jgi:hypothetical protein